jgi:hypothetical protein
MDRDALTMRAVSALLTMRNAVNGITALDFIDHLSF